MNKGGEVSNVKKITPVTSICCVLLASLAILGTIVLYSLDTGAAPGDLELVSGLVTVYTALSLGSLLTILEHCFPCLSWPRGLDRLSLSLAFLIQLLVSVSPGHPAASGPELGLVTASVLLSLTSALSVSASARLVTSLGVILVTQAQGGLSLYTQLTSDGEGQGLVAGVSLLASLCLHTLILAVARLHRGPGLDNFIRRKQWRIRNKKQRQSKETLVRDSQAGLDTSGDTEPINFSFYFKDEISDEIKTVMKTIDEMLISQTGDKKLPAITELPDQETADTPHTRDNVYVNVSVVRSVLDDSKLEETEIV